MPRSVPIISGNSVNSLSHTPAGMYGRKVARRGLSGLNPTRSGNSWAAAASLALMLSLDISSDLRTSLAKRGELGMRQVTLHAADAREQAKGQKAEGGRHEPEINLRIRFASPRRRATNYCRHNHQKCARPSDGLIPKLTFPAAARFTLPLAIIFRALRLFVLSFFPGLFLRTLMTSESQVAAAIDTRSIADLYQRVRARTLEIVAPLEIEDYVVQTAEFMSPPRWHIGHTSWFFETLLQTCLPGYRIYNEEYLYYFNSYYEGFGKRIEKSLRGTRSRPTVKDTVRYRNHVDEAMVGFLKNVETRPDAEKILSLVRMGLEHEMQHQELLVYDIKHLL